MSEADKRQVGGDHYKTMKVQPWDAMEAWLTPEEFIGFLRGNIIKYQARATTDKEPFEVMIGKAAHYQQKLDEVLARRKEPVPELTRSGLPKSEVKMTSYGVAGKVFELPKHVLDLMLNTGHTATIGPDGGLAWVKRV